MKPDFVQTNAHGEPILEIYHLLHWRGYRLNLHKIVTSDPIACYHTHPANAFRIILKGGYLEEVYDEPRNRLIWRKWVPGMMGFVRHDFCHRIDMLLGEASWSLWFRKPRTEKIRLVGSGWGV